MTPKEAGIEGAKEIFFAVISTTITLVAVFFPIVFMEGMTGRLFREFRSWYLGAVINSSFAALTITPMLRHQAASAAGRRRAGLIARPNLSLNGSTAYTATHWPPSCKMVPGPAAGPSLTIGLIGWLWSTIPAEMAPLEDRSQIRINTTRLRRSALTNISATIPKTSTIWWTRSSRKHKR